MTPRHVLNHFAGTGILALLLAASLSGCGGSATSDSGVIAAAAQDAGGTTGSNGTGGSTGSATISWQAPDTNTNGTALTDLAGYYIHYGTDLANLDQRIKIATVGLSNYVIDNLASGTYYFAMTSYTANGVESALSAIVSKTI